MNAVTPSIEVYTTRMCPYCVMAKQLLDKKELSYSEVYVDQDQDRMTEMMQRSQQRSVPQIFINDIHVGGFNDLTALDQKSGLDTLPGIGDSN